MNKSAIVSNETPTELKTKADLLRHCSKLLTSWKYLRVLTNPNHKSSNGHAVAVVEQDLNGKLKFLAGGPDYTFAGVFFKNAVLDKRIS
jgi:hypothetical protein